MQLCGKSRSDQGGLLARAQTLPSPLQIAHDEPKVPGWVIKMIRAMFCDLLFALDRCEIASSFTAMRSSTNLLARRPGGIH